MIPTSFYGARDLTLNEWVIIEVQHTNVDSKTRHIFGFCDYTGVYQLSSAILVETDEYIQTRSRKYFKDGPEFKDNQPQHAMINLVQFLKYGWCIKEEIVGKIIETHSEFLLFGGKVVHDPEDE